MARVLITYSSHTPTVELITEIMLLLGREKNMEIRKKDSGQIRKKDLLWADSVLLIRPYDISCVDIAKTAKLNHKFIIVYLDDDLLNIPDLYSGLLRGIITKLLKTPNQRALKKCLEYCDVLWGSNALLLSKYKKYVSEGRCVRSDITADLSRMLSQSPRNKKVSILFAGAADHAALLNKYIIPALNQVVQVYKEIKVTCIGVEKSRILPCEATIEFIPWMKDYNQYRHVVENGHYNIGIAVVEEEDFYKCKYYNKFIEYSLLGAVGIYTKSEPYNLIVNHGENGFLSESSVDSWAENILYAISHPEECERCITNAQNLIRREFRKDKILQCITGGIPELFEKHRSNTEKLKYHPRIFWYIIRKTGMVVLETIETWREKAVIKYGKKN